ncbi:FMN reductase [Acrocarpospora pleiomorpha]|uniref:FMN reductase n=1 Tax=Acrocarpospora pleiomorpha TaxID=90975 RepID=A0A5M3X6M3_9ACTN|nr:NAD(P)H-dependent oxidoreductase [Acrocarpospora pleiomorpha]GES17337.1 FMN reductase [Acrocarpospora pleiomorpha]
MYTSVVVGNPKPNSRTLSLARAVARALTPDHFESTFELDLALHTDEIFSWPSESMAALSDRVAASNLLIVATPTYKASYSGLLKAFLDRYSHRALHNTLAVAVMTGGGMDHAMSPEAHLRPLLIELGAVVPCASLYFLTSRMHEMDAVVEGWLAENLLAITALRAAVGVRSEAGQVTVG